jgi:hypothetical protein
MRPPPGMTDAQAVIVRLAGLAHGRAWLLRNRRAGCRKNKKNQTADTRHPASPFAFDITLEIL